MRRVPTKKQQTTLLNQEIRTTFLQLQHDVWGNATSDSYCFPTGATRISVQLFIGHTAKITTASHPDFWRLGQYFHVFVSPTNENPFICESSTYLILF